VERRSYEFGPFQFDPAARVLSRSGKILPLTFKAADVLRVLVENRGQIVAKTKLLEEVWPGSFVEDGSVERNISALRKALDGTRTSRQYIETLPKRGYRFAASIRESSGASPSEPRKKTIAILPFRMLGQRARSLELGLSVADTTISTLAQIPGHAVLPTGAVAAFPQEKIDPATFGRSLGADLVLDGSIQFSKNRARATVGLLKAAGGRHVWAETFELPFTNKFRLQDSLAEELAGALALILSNAQRKLLNPKYTQSREAYQLYLKGRYHWGLRSGAGLRLAVACFRGALGLDSEFAPAYSGLANSYAFLPMLTAGRARKFMPKARAAAVSALEIDETLAEARSALAFVKWHYEWDWPGAEREFRRILKFVPDDRLTRQWYALLLAEQGRSGEALEHMKRAVAADPLDASSQANLATILFLAGRYEDAVKQAQRALALNSASHRAYLVIGEAREQQGRFDEAITQFEEARRLSPGPSGSLGSLGHALGCARKAKEAADVLRTLEKVAETRGCWFPLALTHLGLGDLDSSFCCLERACDERDFHLVLLKTDPRFAALRGSERFEAVIQRIGLGEG
jgi:DNA-binding winged helix-turn-helix (wHTH) protein/tetratricopeptide (TPR) repeat protein